MQLGHNLPTLTHNHTRARKKKKKPPLFFGRPLFFYSRASEKKKRKKEQYRKEESFSHGHLSKGFLSNTASLVEVVTARIHDRTQPRGILFFSAVFWMTAISQRNIPDPVAFISFTLQTSLSTKSKRPSLFPTASTILKR